jgi:hypothetical protein
VFCRRPKWIELQSQLRQDLANVSLDNKLNNDNYGNEDKHKGREKNCVSSVTFYNNENSVGSSNSTLFIHLFKYWNVKPF